MKASRHLLLGAGLFAGISCSHAQVHLDLLHASSTASGDPRNLFDAQPATHWAPDASQGGLDESVFMAFDGAFYADSLEIQTPENSDILEFELICNHAVSMRVHPNVRLRLGMSVDEAVLRISKLRHCRPAPLLTGDAPVHRMDCQGNQALQVQEIVFVGGKPSHALQIEPMKAIPGKVFASSVEEPATKYHPAFLFDGRRAHEWATDHGKQGAGESIALSFDQPVRIERIKILKPASDSEKPHANQIHVKYLSVQAGGGAVQSVPVNIEPHWGGSFLDGAGQGHDHGHDPAENPDGAIRYSAPETPFGWYVAQLPKPLAGNTFMVKVQEVLPNSPFKVLHIPEMAFFDGQKWFQMDARPEVYQADFVRAKTKGMVIGDLLDQRFCLVDGAGNELAFSFRSDGSFAFRADALDDYEGPQHFEGTWEHFPPENGVSRVHITGLLSRLNVFDPLSGAWPQDRAEGRVIDWVWKISPEKIVSESRTGLLDSMVYRVLPSSFVPCEKYAPVAVDLRYKTPENFMGRTLYLDCMPCLLREETALALGKAQKALEEKAPGMGYKLLVWDAYRPWTVQVAMWDKVPDSNYVANPYNGGSSHNKGIAIDLTLSLDGVTSIPMGTEYDFFGPKSHHGYTKLPKKVQANRKLLREIMEAAGFEALETEWWHYRLPRDCPIERQSFCE